jgi:hypothetical protein
VAVEAERDPGEQADTGVEASMRALGSPWLALAIQASLAR